MKVWVVCLLLCADFTMRTAVAAAIETEPEQIKKTPEETDELLVEKLIDAEEDKDESLRQNHAVEDKSVFCPPDWFAHGTRCFLLVKSMQSWHNAEAQCVARQGRLASIKNHDEDNFLKTLLRVAGISKAWIGAYNFQGTWRWIDGARLTYANWYLLNSPSSNQCVLMRSDGGWSNFLCDYGYTYASFCSIDPIKC